MSKSITKYNSSAVRRMGTGCPPTLIAWSRLRAYHIKSGANEYPNATVLLGKELTGSPGQEPRSVVEQAGYSSAYYVPPG